MLTKKSIFKNKFMNKDSSTSSFYTTLLLLALLCLKALIMVALITTHTIELGPDEAQYWTWSRTLDWGYYSKPPAIAWQIAAGTALFGNTELGVRFFAIVLSFFQSLALYTLALRSGLSACAAFWSAIIMAFSPIGIFGSLFAVTDGGFLLFWSLSCIIMAAALSRSQGASPLLIGLTIACGALFKWPIYFFWALFLLCRHFYFPDQKLIRLFAGVAISLCGLLPSLWWNSQHDWATFRHVSATLQGGSMEHSSNANPLAFLGSQIALLSPLLFLLLLLSYRSFFQYYKTANPAIRFCGWSSLLTLALFFILSFFQKIQGNWSLLVYPTAIVLLCWAFGSFKEALLLKCGVALSLLLVALALAIPLLQERFPGIYKINPFKQNMGWSALKERLTMAGYAPDREFLVSDKYQTSSILSFYNESQKRAYFLNLRGARKNQFSYWGSLQENERGKNGYFAWIENEPYWSRDYEAMLAFYQKALPDYFHNVELVGKFPLTPFKWLLLFKCSEPKPLEQGKDAEGQEIY